MTRYNPEIMQKFANRLYARANFIIAAFTLLGLILAGIGGFGLEGALKTGKGEVVIAVAALLGGLLGCLIGTEIAFLLKFKAQLALCFRQIELNTRPGGA